MAPRIDLFCYGQHGDYVCVGRGGDKKFGHVPLSVMSEHGSRRCIEKVCQPHILWKQMR